MARRQETVPAAPFAEWLNLRLGQIASRPNTDLDGAVAALVREIGWDTMTIEAGKRKLYRYRHQLMEGSVNRVKRTRHAERFPRATVEDALHHAGVLFEHVYPDIAAEEEVWLEPERWCPHCQESRSPIDGQCPFCNWRLGPKTGQKLLGRRFKKAA